jgi:hypothetical protein
MGHAKGGSICVACCRDRGYVLFFSGADDDDDTRRRGRPRQRQGCVGVRNNEPHTDVMTRLPHSSIPKRPSVCAFHEAMERRERVDVITTRPEMSPENMRSLSLEMNNALIAEVCERMMCSGGGAEARADIRWKRSGWCCWLPLIVHNLGKSGRSRRNKWKNVLLYSYLCMSATSTRTRVVPTSCVRA